VGVTIETRYGKVAGSREDGLEIFRGIPFASPPLGPLRFRPPEPPEPWAGVRDATSFGPSAPQNPLPQAFPGLDVGPQSEDCLYLNVYTPATDDARRPVLVWIHGGAFVIGSGSQDLYDGAPLARRGDAVVVTLNYRLGALGFLHLADLCGHALGTEPNAGILDQIAALEWVREHIARFGGDPDNVTVFGESAGGMSVGTLLGMPAARGLFRRAIPQSGAAHSAHSRDAATTVAERFLAELGLGTAQAQRIREEPVERLLEAQRRLMEQLHNEPLEGAVLTFGPVIDGTVLQEPPIDAIRRGSAGGVDLLVGTTRDEWRLFTPMDPSAMTLDDAGLLRRLERRVPGRDTSGTSHAVRLVEVYRKAREGRLGTAAPDLLAALETDRVFRIPAIRLAEAQLAYDARVFAYLVTWESPLLGGMLGACHAIELPFVFGTTGHAELFVGSGPDVRALESHVMDAWLSFARTGDPAHPGLPSWPAYDTGRRATMLLGRECQVSEAPFDAERQAWDGLL
jgi:para-nitrobenzyl esterase